MSGQETFAVSFIGYVAVLVAAWIPSQITLLRWLRHLDRSGRLPPKPSWWWWSAGLPYFEFEAAMWRRDPDPQTESLRRRAFLFSRIFYAIFLIGAIVVFAFT